LTWIRALALRAPGGALLGSRRRRVRLRFLVVGLAGFFALLVVARGAHLSLLVGVQKLQGHLVGPVRVRVRAVLVRAVPRHVVRARQSLERRRLPRLRGGALFREPLHHDRGHSSSVRHVAHAFVTRVAGAHGLRARAHAAGGAEPLPGPFRGDARGHEVGAETHRGPIAFLIDEDLPVRRDRAVHRPREVRVVHRREHLGGLPVRAGDHRARHVVPQTFAARGVARVARQARSAVLSGTRHRERRFLEAVPTRRVASIAAIARARHRSGRHQLSPLASLALGTPAHPANGARRRPRDVPSDPRERAFSGNWRNTLDENGDQSCDSRH
jgi:hypothetical protein